MVLSTQVHHRQHAGYMYGTCMWDVYVHVREKGRREGEVEKEKEREREREREREVIQFIHSCYPQPHQEC